MIRALKLFLAALGVFVLLFLSLPQEALAETHEGFLEVAGGHSLYVKYTEAEENQPTLVLLHGLTYSMWQWEAFYDYLVEQGFGVLSYDMYGMGKTLLRHGPVFQPIHHYEQVQDLAALLEKLNIEGPYNLVGLSYGAGIATAFAESFPSQVAKLFLMAPYTEPLKEQDDWIKQQIKTTRVMFPFNPATDDQLYDYFLRQIIYSTYPSAEPIVLENPLKLEAVFRMVQGIRKYRGIDSGTYFSEASVHLMVPSEDQYIKKHVYDSFWLGLPEKSRATYLYIRGAEHKVPQSVPLFSAGWVAAVMKDSESFKGGHIYEGFPLQGKAKSGSHEVNLPKGIEHVRF